MLHLTILFEEKPKSNLPGDNLKYYRLRKSLTTRQLAKQIDVVPATILMYEQNKHPILYDMTNKLAEVLDIDASILYDDFADFLAAPYNEALKDIRSALEMSQKAFAEHIVVISQLLLQNRSRATQTVQKSLSANGCCSEGRPSHILSF